MGGVPRGQIYNARDPLTGEYPQGQRDEVRGKADAQPKNTAQRSPVRRTDMFTSYEIRPC